MRDDVQTHIPPGKTVTPARSGQPKATAPIVRIFSALADKRIACMANLPPDPPVLELAFDPKRFEEGTPLLDGVDAGVFRNDFLAAAACLLPGMAELFPPVSGELLALADGLSRNPALADACLAALWGPQAESEAAWEKVATLAGVPAPIAAFGAEEAFKICLTRLEPVVAGHVIEDTWFRGYCPICGAYPDLGFLAPKEPEPTEYLISKSGQMHLHCARCGHRWRFVRIKCPSCETTDHEKFTSLCVDDHDGERVYTCHECGKYFPCVDLTEGENTIRFDTAALDLLHLEYVASSRGFTPLAVQAWNMFA